MAAVVYRFRRDLRLDDHAGLAAAGRRGEILPLLVLDSETEARLSRSPKRWAFYCSAVAALDGALRQRGSQLIVRRGPASAVIREIARQSDATGVVWSSSYDPAGVERDEELQSELEESGLWAHIVHDSPAIPPEETACARPSQGEGYRAFVPYFDVWRKLHAASYEVPLLLPFASSDVVGEGLPRVAEAFKEDGAADPDVAWRVLTEFLRGPGLAYSAAVNVPADDRTSHLSAHLSFGTLSARVVVRETLARIDDPFLLTEERTSLRLFLRSLAMRDFFLQLAWYHAGRPDEVLQPKMRGFPFAESHPELDAWRAGCTGYPLIDAGIRQLHATGWMHPRVRAIAASFLCFDLGVDWRIGRDEWEKYLIEDDPALSNGNWQWIAGVGADLAAYPRIYNPRKQARQFDAAGVYARRWIPELAHLPSGAFGRPKEHTAQIDLPLFSGSVSYPAPVVDHERAARAFLERYRAHEREIAR
ncbi:MAG: DNA photolyase family protein [Candidatus Eremiobacteraeota bacterium]|nr:DNA photolyase family protein [Candidatus Eremiobacteraeota bacterium]